MEEIKKELTVKELRHQRTNLLDREEKMYKQNYKEACIVEIDIVGFTKYKNADDQREILRVFQNLLEKAGNFITP